MTRSTSDKSADIKFSGKRPGQVSFFLPNRVPVGDWVKTRLATLREVDGVSDVECLLGGYQLRVTMARRYDLEDALADIIATVMDLMGLDSVCELAVHANRNKLSLAANDLLVEALQHIADIEWEEGYRLRLQEAREEWKQTDGTLGAMIAARQAAVADEARIAKSLADAEEALHSANQTYDVVRKDTSHDAARAANRIVDVAQAEVDTLKEALAFARNNLKADEKSLSSLQSRHDKARITLEDLENQMRPDVVVDTEGEGKTVTFTVVPDPDSEELDTVPESEAEAELSEANSEDESEEDESEESEDEPDEDSLEHVGVDNS